MAVQSNTVPVATESYPGTILEETKELPDEYAASTKRVTVLKVAHRRTVIDHIRFSYDTVGTASSTVEFVKLTAAQKADDYIAAPSSTTGTCLSVNSSGTRTPHATDANALTSQTVNLKYLTEKQRTLEAGERLVAIQLGLTASGTGTGSGGDSAAVGLENFGVSFLGRTFRI